MKVKKKKLRVNNSKTVKDEAASCSWDRNKVTIGVKQLGYLYQWSTERCEFCEEVFNNKYSMLVHNAKHIIIPLLKQKMHQCPECLHQFTTIESLEWHTLNKHQNITRNLPELLKSFVKIEPTIVVETSTEVNNTIIEKESLLESLVKREPITLLTKEEFVLNNPDVVHEISDDNCRTIVKSEHIDEIIVGNDNTDMCVTVKSDIEVSYDNDDNYDYHDSNIDYNDSKSIKERLKFEDEPDETCLSIINDLTTELKVDLEVFDVKWVNSDQNPKRNDSNGDGRNNTIHSGKAPLLQVWECWKSIHYDDLVNSGEYTCRKCYVKFPNRYECIVHESVHMKLKRPRAILCRHCDWYVSSSPMGLRSHKRREHSDVDNEIKQELKKCEDCGLHYVQINRHMLNYHQASGSIPTCSNILQTMQQQNGDSLEAEVLGNGERLRDVPGQLSRNWSSKRVNVCDMCYYFLKNKVNVTYKYFGEYSEVGRRHQCERCQKSSFTLNTVQLRSRRMHRHGFGQEKKKALTNTERLKNLQQRLKKLKSMNKY